jgi:hypothetical protein
MYGAKDGSTQVKELFLGSYVLTPSRYISIRSSTSGSRYTSISPPGDLGPGMRKVRIKLGCFMHIHEEGCTESKG